MERRAFLSATLGFALLAPAWGQPSRKIFRLVLVNPLGPATQITKEAPHFKIFFEELGSIRLNEGETLSITRFGSNDYQGRFNQFSEQVRTLRPDVIFAFGDALLVPLKKALPDIPIVGISTDPVGSGLVASYSRPGANFTGVTHTAGVEIFAKQVQLLKKSPRAQNASAISVRPLPGTARPASLYARPPASARSS